MIIMHCLRLIKSEERLDRQADRGRVGSRKRRRNRGRQCQRSDKVSDRNRDGEREKVGERQQAKQAACVHHSTSKENRENSLKMENIIDSW